MCDINPYKCKYTFAHSAHCTYLFTVENYLLTQVSNVAFSYDSRWVTVTTKRGTSHVFPITSYGGKNITVYQFLVQFSSVQFNLVQFNLIQFSSVQFSSVQLSSAQLSSFQFSLVSGFSFVTKCPNFFLHASNYLGPVSLRTHNSDRVVNRSSRFHTSAGLEDLGENSGCKPVVAQSGSPTTNPLGPLTTAKDCIYVGKNGLVNPRMPPLPHPELVVPYVQIKLGASR